MKWKIRKNFRRTESKQIIDKGDNILILLDNQDLADLFKRGFITDTGAAGANITIKLKRGGLSHVNL